MGKVARIVFIKKPHKDLLLVHIAQRMNTFKATTAVKIFRFFRSIMLAMFEFKIDRNVL